MGFWDFVAPDLDEFREVLRPVVPQSTIIGPFVFSQEELIDLAWLSPGSGIGLAARLYLELDRLGVGPSVAAVVQQAVAQQGTAGGFSTENGFGGSFGWKSEPDMPVLIIPNTFRVAIEAESGAQVVTNVVGVVNGGGTAAGAAAAVQTAWKVASGPLSQLTSLYALTGFRALDLSSANGAIAFIGDTTQGGGASNPSKATNGSAALVKWNGGTRSRSSRGRMYFGPLREIDINTDGRTLDPTRRTAISAAFDAFRASLSSSGYPLAVISPTTSSAFTVTSSAVESVIATQRRRIRS